VNAGQGFQFASWQAERLPDALVRGPVGCVEDDRRRLVGPGHDLVVDDLTNSTVKSDALNTQSYSELRDAIDDMRFAIKVMLKPARGLPRRILQGESGAGESVLWFQTYQRYITTWPGSASKKNVGCFCVGVGLDSDGVAAYSNNLEDVDRRRDEHLHGIGRLLGRAVGESGHEGPFCVTWTTRA